ncbi:MAG: hypothetical protein AAFX54_19160, partial [Pseudomonadota bacterium]
AAMTSPAALGSKPLYSNAMLGVDAVRASKLNAIIVAATAPTSIALFVAGNARQMEANPCMISPNLNAFLTRALSIRVFSFTI